MQTANILLSLGGDHGNTIMKHGVTAAEIAVLRAIHGDEAVKEVEPTGDVKRSHREERARLIDTYGRAKIPDTNTPIVDSMFPGIAARVFESLHELDLPEVFFKATGHLKAPAAKPDRDDGPTIAEWVAAGYSASVYPPSGFASKSTPEEIAAFQPAPAAAPLADWQDVAAADAPSHDAPVDEGDEPVGDDINDAHAESNVLG